MLRLLRCRFMKSGPSRGPPSGSPVSRWAGRLDLDDIGAPVGELPHAGRARADPGQIQHGETRKGLRGPRKRHQVLSRTVFDPPGRAVDIPQCRNDCLRLSPSAALPQRHRPYGVLQGQDSPGPNRRSLVGGSAHAGRSTKRRSAATSWIFSSIRTPPRITGQSILAVRVDAFCPVEVFKRNVDVAVRAIREVAAFARLRSHLAAGRAEPHQTGRASCAGHSDTSNVAQKPR